MTSLLISDDLAKRLAELAAKAKLSQSEYAEQLLEDALEEQEDYLIAFIQSERIAKGLDKTLSLQEAMKELDLTPEDLR